jgi:hypothetical protein
LVEPTILPYHLDLHIEAPLGRWTRRSYYQRVEEAPSFAPKVLIFIVAGEKPAVSLHHCGGRGSLARAFLGFVEAFTSRYLGVGTREWGWMTFLGMTTYTIKDRQWADDVDTHVIFLHWSVTHVPKKMKGGHARTCAIHGHFKANPNLG